jgi:hypothetical protein
MSQPGICKWCAQGIALALLDADGVLTSVSGKPGTVQHHSDDRWWPCEAIIYQPLAVPPAPPTGPETLATVRAALTAIIEKARQFEDAVFEEIIDLAGVALGMLDIAENKIVPLPPAPLAATNGEK